MLKQKMVTLAAAVLLLAAASTAHAAVIVLDFEGLAPYPPPLFGNILIQQFYNGGAASNGVTGPNYGIAFSTNATLLCLDSITVNCSNTSRGGLAPESDEGAVQFLSNESIVNVAAGFDTGFSFNYVSARLTAAVTVFDGLNGSGNALAVLLLPPNAGLCPGYNTSDFCPFSPIGLTFGGIARSVSFTGAAAHAFDDLTFGSAVPGAGGTVPEPATLSMLGGGLLTVIAARRRTRAAKNQP